MADEDKGKVAGHPPAVKAGGMRIVQHKTPSAERPAKDPVEVIGLSNPAPNVNTGEVVQSSTSNKHNEHSVEASQVAHAQKPPAQIPQKPVNNIQQPRKFWTSDYESIHKRNTFAIFYFSHRTSIGSRFSVLKFAHSKAIFFRFLCGGLPSHPTLCPFLYFRSSCR